jgi:DNA (cytosine-5)-methyltransferase 1
MTEDVAQPLRGNPYNNSDPLMEARMHIVERMHGARGAGRDGGVGIGGEVAGTLDASYYKGCGSANYGEREVVAVWRAGDQANAETLVNLAGTLNCNKGQQGGILFHPEVSDVCGTLSDGAHNGGGLNGQDAYTGRILPFAFDARQNDVLLYGDKTGPLDTDGHSVGVCVTGDRTHALKAEGADGSEDGTGRGTPIVPMAFSVKDSGNDATVDLAPTLRAGGHTSSHANAGVMPGIAIGMAVRRLTPRECERLQGFPDDYTRIPWKKKPADECPDGPRYKALGNSMAVPVMRWIGERIAKVEQV